MAYLNGAAGDDTITSVRRRPRPSWSAQSCLLLLPMEELDIQDWNRNIIITRERESETIDFAVNGQRKYRKVMHIIGAVSVGQTNEDCQAYERTEQAHPCQDTHKGMLGSWRILKDLRGTRS